MPTLPHQPTPDDDDFIEEMVMLQMSYDAMRNLYRRISEENAWSKSDGREPLLNRIAEQGSTAKRLIDNAIEDWFRRW